MSVGTPRVSGFDDLEVIGRGGFSTVYSAVQVDLGRRVAIKVLNFDVTEGVAQRRFERECKVVGILSGVPGVVAVHQSAFTDDGRPCIVMQLMEGGTLQSHVSSNGPLGFDDAKELTLTLAEALAAAHAKDVAHRDIKPGNVLLSADGSPALGDFGIAVVEHLASSSQTIESLSPPFAPPERLVGGEIDEKLADIYSLGATIAFALTGSAPFGTAQRGGVSGLVQRVLQDPPPDLTGCGVPAEFAGLITGMLDKRPDRRPASAAEVASRAVAGAPCQSSAPAPKATTPPAADGSRQPAQHPTSAASSDVVDARVVIPPAPGSPAEVEFSLDFPAVGGVETPPPYNPPQDLQSAFGDDPDTGEDRDSGVWPTAVDYVHAIQDPANLLDTALASATLQEDMLGMPVSAAGQSAVVFHIESDGEPAAVRFFTRPPRDGRTRYQALAQHMVTNPCQPVVPARWVESAVRIDEHERPAVWMPWVQGRPLNLVVEDLLADPLRIESLAMVFLDVLDALRGSGMAHGDLQNGNILVTDDLSVSLVDLDGIWVPSLEGRPPGETGHLCFQHRSRAPGNWGPEMDTFSGLLIVTSLLALAADPQLWQFHQGENLILDATDLRRAGTTEAWQAMAASRSPLVQELTATLAEQAAAVDPPVGAVRALVEAHGGTEEATLRKRTPAAAGSVAPARSSESQAEVTAVGSDWWVTPSGDLTGTGAVQPPVASGAVGSLPNGSVWSTAASAGSTATGSAPVPGRRMSPIRSALFGPLLIGLVAGVVGSLCEALGYQLFDTGSDASALLLAIAPIATFGGLLRAWPSVLSKNVGASLRLGLLGALVAGGVMFLSMLLLAAVVTVDGRGMGVGVAGAGVLIWAAPTLGVALGLVGATRSVSAALTYTAAGLIGGALAAVPIAARGVNVLGDGSLRFDMSDAAGPAAVIASMMLVGLAVGVCQSVVNRARSEKVFP